MLHKSPTILAFDTSAAHCAAALLQGDTITTRIDEMAKGQAEHLEVGAVAGAFAGLAMGLTGLFTAFLLPLMVGVG